ncbi:anthraniloyl-CoA monooxygenase [Paraburkholderia sp. BL23I1N1]|uniref:FAD-dependent monooxygenase n=1 Tax=Paraburkholderia sp. BL23I1N1 TaxID=1938802 RepID=UPI000E729BD5|nr:FAD-dependent monooxygenase [Paraburkholderia sp. BL23I1N1]RKE36359.1 anthraniloyl-CoA monooxygenase [Paraburkholderia sp. BL23I1N1]
MKIDIVGGGPGGLFLSYLVKKRFPAWTVRVFEQNDADATYGWGVVFSDVALKFLEEADRAFFKRFTAEHVRSDHMEVVHRGVHVPIDGHSFSRVSRIALLKFLHAECRAADVELLFNTRVDDVTALHGADLVVVSDGVNSRSRSQLADVFKPSFVQRRNKFAWYGTAQLISAVSLIFRATQHGVFIAHSYQYSAGKSTFLIETDPQTWQRAGFDQMSDEQSRALCGRIFADDLGGHPLLSNKSSWFEAVTVKNEKWHDGNIVLLGDALRSVHFSLGSGTRMAMEDAIALCNGLVLHQKDLGAVFDYFETTRRPVSDRFQDAAAKSLDWYENVADQMHLEPIDFAYSYMRRTGRVTHDDLRQRAPGFARQYELIHGEPVS